MRYWIFKCNPDIYRIDERLKDAETRATWKVTKYKDEIQKGDKIFIWRTGGKRGICGIMQIDSPPKMMAEIESEQKYYVERDDKIIFRVEGTITHRVNCISYKELKKTQGLENLSIFSGFQQGTNFKITNQEGEILMNMVEDCEVK